MKKINFYAIVMFFSLILFSSNIFAQSNNLEPVKKDINGLNIQVDPRIELLTTVQIISEYPFLTSFESGYKSKVIKYFSPYSNHKAVKLFKEMYPEGFSFDAPPAIMLHYSSSIDLKLIHPLEDDYIERAGGQEKLDEFMEALRQFAADTKFDEFYNSNIEYYKKMVNLNANTIKNKNYIEEVENFFGKKNNSYTVILASLVHPGGFGSNIKLENGESDIYSVLGPTEMKSSVPSYGTQDDFKELIWHEFSHSFVNPITEKNINEVNKYKNLFTPISERMSSQAYTSWETCVNEHLLRAITARRAYIDNGYEAYQNNINYEKNRGFFYVKALAEKIAEYEKTRNQYKDFEEFYPEIIKTFEDLSNQSLGEDFYVIPFSGTVSSATTTGKDNIIIVPTNEKNKTVQKSIHEYCVEIKELLEENTGKETLIIEDVEALKTDLSNKNILVYGTVKGNLFLNKYSSILPFTIEENKITTGKTYNVKNHRLIAAYENPLNKICGMVVYTAQDAKDIVGINKIFHSNESYYVANGENIIEKGNYIKLNSKWVIPKNN